MEKTSIEALTGYLGIGSIEMLGAFLIADGRSNLIDNLNKLQAPESLAIAGAVPLLVMCYVIGLVTATLVQASVFAVVKPSIDIDTLAIVSTLENQALAAKLVEIDRHAKLLFGCGGAFLVVALGCFLEVYQLGSDFAYIGNTCAAIGVIIAIACIPLGYKLQTEFAELVTAVASRLVANQIHAAKEPGNEIS